jgi:chromosome partitioning protein
MPPKIITFSNQKGGVGKTTLTREIGIYLASIGRATLLIDMDPQGNLTRSLTDDPANLMYGALTEGFYSTDEVKENLFLIGGDIRLASLEKSLIAEIDAYIRLRELLGNQLLSLFEFILIDTPPSLGVLSVNALAAARHIIIPMNPSIFSMQGANDLMQTVSKVKKNLNPKLNLLGVIINAFDSIPVITRQIRKEIEEAFGGKVFPQALSRSIRIEEGIAEKAGVTTSARTKVKDEVMVIAEEMLHRLVRLRSPQVERFDRTHPEPQTTNHRPQTAHEEDLEL